MGPIEFQHILLDFCDIVVLTQYDGKLWAHSKFGFEIWKDSWNFRNSSGLHRKTSSPRRTLNLPTANHYPIIYWLAFAIKNSANKNNAMLICKIELKRGRLRLVVEWKRDGRKSELLVGFDTDIVARNLRLDDLMIPDEVLRRLTSHIEILTSLFLESNQTRWTDNFVLESINPFYCCS